MHRPSLLVPALVVASILLPPVPADPRTEPATPAATPTANILVRGEGYEGVIFATSDAPSLVRALGYREAEFAGYWTPTSDDVRRLEARIEQFLRDAAPGVAPDLWRRLPGYRRQYAGVVRDGERLILANAFCDPLGTEWQTTPIAVADGGDCYVRLTFDPASTAFADLSVNGEA